MKDLGLRFREMLRRPQGVFGFGVATALDASLAEGEGAECIYAGGYSIAMAKMLPDMGMMNMVEVRSEVEAIARSVAIPVIADVDDGYGNALNLMRTVSEFFGRIYLDFRGWQTHQLAGIHIEDQRYPKRCGHIAGKEIVSIAEAAKKFEVAAKIRDVLNPSGVVIARTDAYHSGLEGSMEEAIERARAYAGSGADLAWCEFNDCTRESAMRFAEGVRKRRPDYPLAFNYSPSLPWSQQANPMTFEELNEMGYKFIFITIAAAHAASFGVVGYMRLIREQGAAALWHMQEIKRGDPSESHHKMAGVPMWQDYERAFVPDAEGRQSAGEGFRVR